MKPYSTFHTTIFIVSKYAIVAVMA